MSSKIESLSCFFKHKLFAVGLGGIAQSVLYTLVWNYWGASFVRSGGQSSLTWLLLSSLVCGGSGYIFGGLLMGQKVNGDNGVSPTRLSSVALFFQALVALSLPIINQHQYILLGLFGLCTGIYYAGRNIIEVGYFSDDHRDGWLAAQNVLMQIVMICMPFLVTFSDTLQHKIWVNSPMMMGPLILFCTFHFFVAYRLWVLPVYHRKKPINIKLILSAFGDLYRSRAAFFFGLEGMFWASKIFSYPLAAGLLIYSISNQGLLEGAAALLSAVVGANLIKRWSKQTRGGMLVFSMIPLLIVWTFVAFSPSSVTALALIITRNLFQPFNDTAIRSIVLGGLKNSSDCDGLENLCAREIILIFSRGSMCILFGVLSFYLGVDQLLKIGSLSIVVLGFLWTIIAIKFQRATNSKEGV